MIRELREKLQGELKALHHELHHELPKEIKRALALGDLRENAEYHSALERQSYVKARIGHLRRRLSEIASFNYAAIPKDRVGLGSTVKLLDLVTEIELTYKIVMNDDADITHGKISVGSPIGRGLAGREVGDEVTIQIPSGTKRFEIVELRTLHEEDQDAAAEAAAAAAAAAAAEANADETEDAGGNGGPAEEAAEGDQPPKE